ncbi:MAG: DUF2064 domain-containing protein, partial [Armatimonadetes bacterium]|nr:DUF2064 domain-containing protein [Armatimonadota bacterium]
MKPGAIVVLARVPRPGQAKTRLEPRLGAVGAAALAACFLQDTLTGALAVGADVFLAFTPAECQGEVRSLVLPGVHLFPQVEGDLGRRQAAAFRIARSQGPGPVLLIGSDSPTLPVPILADALARLRAAPEEILLGPTEDGGYYLLGLSEWPGGLLDQVTWSSPTVYE